MPNYRYFIKKLWRPHMGWGGEYNYYCIRVPEGDPRIPELTKQHNPSWDVFVNYPYAPTTKEELFRLQTHFQAFGTNFVIETPEDAEKPKQLK
jgi:hypothetical protein